MSALLPDAAITLPGFLVLILQSNNATRQVNHCVSLSATQSDRVFRCPPEWQQQGLTSGDNSPAIAAGSGSRAAIRSQSRPIAERGEIETVRPFSLQILHVSSTVPICTGLTCVVTPSTSMVYVCTT